MITTFNLNEIPGFEDTTRKQHYYMYYQFQTNSELMKTLKPVSWAFEKLRSRKDEWRDLYVVTGRNKIWENATIDQMSMFFPNIFNDIYHLDHKWHWDDLTKSKICIDIGAKVMIEDAPHSAIDTAGNSIYTFLIHKPRNYNWLQENPAYPNIQAVQNWQEIW